jgi:molybdopterin-guanine dinucleotide biosynthesis protein A
VAKGLERVGDKRIIDRVADTLRETADDLLLEANDPAAASWLPGVRVERDVRPGLGSLGGLHSALYHARNAVIVAAWDMPFVPVALLHRLRQLGDGVDAAVPESGSRRGVEPLCAWYGPNCLAAIDRALDRDDRRVIAFFDAVRVARLPAAEVSAYGDPEWMFMNVNTADDLARAEAYAATASGGHHRSQE